MRERERVGEDVLNAFYILDPKMSLISPVGSFVSSPAVVVVVVERFPKTVANAPNPPPRASPSPPKFFTIQNPPRCYYHSRRKDRKETK